MQAGVGGFVDVNAIDSGDRIEDQRDRVHIAVDGDCHPWIAGAARRSPSIYRDSRQRHASPGNAAIKAYPRNKATRATVGKAILLPRADDVQRIRWIDRDARLKLGIEVVRPGLPR